MQALPGVKIDCLPRGLPTDSHYPRVSASAGADYPYSQVFCIRGCYPQVPKTTDDGYGVSASEIPTDFYPRMTDNTRGQLYIVDSSTLFYDLPNQVRYTKSKTTDLF